GYNGDVLALGSSLVLLEHNGKTIAAFGVNGWALMPSGFVPQRFAVEQDGSIALVGTVARGGGEEPAVVRLTAGGWPDPTFGSDGLVVLPPPTDEQGHQLKSVTPGGLVVQPNGDIVLTLRGVTPPTPTFEYPMSVLERVTGEGTLDASFGANGQAVIGRAGEEVGVSDPVLGVGGNILVGIEVSSGTGAHSYLAVWRVSADGLALPDEPGLERLPLRYPAGSFVSLSDSFGFLLRSEGSYLKASFVYIGTDKTEHPNPLPNEEELVLPDGATDHEGLVAAQADGKLILAGSAPLANGEQGIFLERLYGVSAPATINLPTEAIHRGLRSITLRLSCSRARSCHGLAELSSSARPIIRYASSRMFTIAPGHSRNVILGFSRAGRRRFSKRARTRVRLTVILNDAPGASASITLPTMH
ncbi:MAG: delta-60 repeat domain-containing protein, partial [Solirubrobacteraceae bacterium]